MRSFDKAFLQEQAVPLQMAGTLRTLGEYQGRQELFTKQTPQAIETLKHIAIIQSTESSNRIEGITVQKDRLKKLVEKKTAAKNRPEAEVVGYRDVLARIHTNFRRMEVSPELILQFHKEMYRHTNLPAGVWKKRDNTVEEQLPDGRWITRFVPVPARQTARYVKEMCHQFNQLWESQEVDRLLLLHAFVLDFLCIHPFTDGNGRIARLLTVLLLHKAGYDVGRYISIERLIEGSKENYYEVLQKVSHRWHEGRHRILPWWEYSLGILLAAYKEFEERVGALKERKGAKTTWVIQAIEKLPDTFSMGELTRSCPGVSRPMLRVVLENLRKVGKLKNMGAGRSAVWKHV